VFKKPKAFPFDAPDEWGVIRGEHQGQPMLVRVNLGLTQVVGHPDYGVQMGVAVPLNSPLPDGWPAPQEDEQLRAIEENLQRELEGTERAVLAAVITTGGMREFVFYTRSRDWIREWAARFNKATDSHTVQVMAQQDPKWSVFLQFAGGLTDLIVPITARELG